VTIAITAIWELFAKRAFFGELMAVTNVSQTVQNAGLVSLSFDFQNCIDWQTSFRRVAKLDIFFAYGRSWRNIYSEDLRNLGSRTDVQVRIILPDPDKQQIIEDLARRFGTTVEDMKGQIETAKTELETLLASNSGFSLWYAHIAGWVFVDGC